MLFNDKGVIECAECRGHKVIHKPVDLIEVCPSCRGAGGSDWVEYAMSRRSEYSQQMLFNTAHRNIQHLIHLIYEEGRKVGEDINVKIEHRPMEDPYKIMPAMLLRR